MGNKKRNNPKPDNKPMTALQKRKRKEAKAERQKKYQWVFMNGKQVRIRRPETIDGLDTYEFIRQNADDIWLTQNGYHEILQERYMQEEQELSKSKTDDDESLSSCNYSSYEVTCQGGAGRQVVRQNNEDCNMTIDFNDKHNSLLKDKKLSSSLQQMNFEFTKLNLRGSLAHLSESTRRQLTSFARDGAGGVFCLKDDDQRIVYIDSEGSGGYIANSFDEIILIVSAFPYALQDLISVGFSLNSLKELSQSVLQELKEEVEETHYKKIIATSQYLSSLSDSTNALEPVDLLFLGLNIDPPFRVYGADDQEYEQFFENA